AFGIMIAGDGLLVFAALAADPVKRLAMAIAGMFTIGVGAALANPQISGVALALAPSTHAGMTSAMTMIVRQAGFSISIAALGASLGTTGVAAAFAAPFSLAALVTLLTMMVALALLPAKSEAN